MNLRQIKKDSIDKKSQGDVNIYFLKGNPNLETQPHKDPVLVVGQSGNHHRLTGSGFSSGKTATGQFVVEVFKKGVTFAHEQHKPPIALPPGWYLFDRAREKGMFDDMVNPVAD